MEGEGAMALLNPGTCFTTGSIFGGGKNDAQKTELNVSGKAWIYPRLN